MSNVVPIRPAEGWLECSSHPRCEGPRLCEDHDEICNRGDDCDLDTHWRGCKWCKEMELPEGEG